MAYSVSSGQIDSINSGVVSDGGMMFVPGPIPEQLVYLDFDGELTSYNGEILSLKDVKVENSRLTEERVVKIVDMLHSRFAGLNVRFVTERPKDTDFSTIYIGQTSAFDPYGRFAGLAETVDSGNRNRSDNAFVMLNADNPDDEIVNTIAHEAGHLLGTLDKIP